MEMSKTGRRRQRRLRCNVMSKRCSKTVLLCRAASRRRTVLTSSCIVLMWFGKTERR